MSLFTITDPLCGRAWEERFLRASPAERLCVLARRDPEHADWYVTHGLACCDWPPRPWLPWVAERWTKA